MSLRGGALRHSITIQRRPATLDELGHDIPNNWAPVSGRIPCTVKELRGRELEVARQQVAEADVEITCRPTTILTTDRIVYGDRIFQPESIVVDERRTKQTILCTETK
jgi:SPP1 family predicted phage head-tail adaptor